MKRFRLITGEKSKSCLIVAVGALFYLIEAAFEERSASLLLAFGLFLVIHAVVIVGRVGFMAHGYTREATSRGVRTIVLATLLMSVVAIAWIYASGKAFQANWQIYVNALVIGGLSATLHLIPVERLKRRRGGGVSPTA
jgi:hypothetical protein